MLKGVIGAVAVALTFAAYVPYYRDILRGKTRPHIYSWSLWALLTILLVALQIKGGAGPATWVTAAAGLLCVGVVLLSLKNGKRDITVSDTVVAALSLLAMGFWLIADQPVTAITLATLADLLAFVPTIRKSYRDPYSETLSLYITNALRFCLALLAVEHYTYISSVWIVAWVIGNAGLAVLIGVRRGQVRVAVPKIQRFADKELAAQVVKEKYPNTANVSFVEHGYDNLVVLVNDQYALRFPKNAHALVRSKYEKQVLLKLASLKEVAIPFILGEESDPPYLITKFIPGRHISIEEINSFPVVR